MKSSGIQLTDGKLAGMTNLASWGEAKMETKKGKSCTDETLMNVLGVIVCG